MSFEQFKLDPRIMRGVQDAGYKSPTPIQEQAIPTVMEGHDVLGLAQTGTGKTAAFMLPVLNGLVQSNKRKIRVLVVAPTRELAQQIHVSAQTFAKHTNIRSMTMYGGIGKGKQRDSLKRGVDIIVACPGRFLDMHSEGGIDLSNIEVLILDEADHMCDMGFLPDIKRIVKLLPKKRQTLFFSATMPSEIRQLSNTILNNPKTVQIGIIAPAKTVSHAIFRMPDTGAATKQALLTHILATEPTGRVLVFTRTKRRAKVVARKLERRKYSVAALQGNMSQNARQRAIDGFRSGKFSILIATDIAARGIDVSDISHVINFDMPDTVDAYTHRIGRTGRAKQSGDAYTFVTSDDTDTLRRVERLLKQKIKENPLPKGLMQAYAEAEKALPREEPKQNNNGGGRGRGNGNKNGGGRGRNGGNGSKSKSSSRRRRSRNNSGNKAPTS